MRDPRGAGHQASTDQNAHDGLRHADLPQDRGRRAVFPRRPGNQGLPKFRQPHAGRAGDKIEHDEAQQHDKGGAKLRHPLRFSAVIVVLNCSDRFRHCQLAVSSNGKT